MDAVTYLLSRKSKSAYRLSGLFLIASIIIWANLKTLEWAKLHFSQALSSGIPSLAYSILSFLTYFACIAGVGGLLAALPCQQMFALSGTLRKWSENRILDEFTSTGLTHRYLLNQLLKYYLSRWLVLSIPSFLFASLALALFEPRALLFGLIYYPLTCVLFLAVTCSACWSVASEKHSSAFAFLPLLAIGGPFVVLLAVWGATEGTALVSALYIGVMSYIFALRALENRETFEAITVKVKGKLELPKAARKASSENPILARHEMRGMRIDDLSTILSSSLILLLVLRHASSTGEFEPAFLLILLASVGASWRAAGKLSQSLTVEMEGSTLETIRSTPMGSEKFLQGWLRLTLRPLVAEMALLVALTVPFIIQVKPQALSGFLFIAIIALSAPFLGALFGASIAGQCRPRSEVSGQISTAIILFSILGLPQVIITLHSYESPFGPIFFALLLVSGACWVLKAGARKSLNRVFLPQK